MSARLLLSGASPPARARGSLVAGGAQEEIDPTVPVWESRGERKID